MTMNRPPDEANDARDTHLLAALRHAPDRDAMPAARLSAAILAQARQAVRAPPSEPSRWRAWQAAIERIRQPAPMAAFGTLAMAALIGVMWQAPDLPDATPGLRPERVATAPMPGRQASTDRAAVAEPSPGALGPAPPPAVAVARSTAPALSDAAKSPSEAAAKAAPATRTRRDAQGNAVALQRDEQHAADAHPQAAPPSPSAAPGPVAAPATPSAQAPAIAVAPPPEPAAAARSGLSAERREAFNKSADSVQPQSRTSADAQTGRLAAAPAPATASEPLAPVSADLDAAIRSDPGRVRWRAPTQRVFNHDAERSAWWSALVRATQGRWERAAVGAATGAERAAVTLMIDGAARGNLVFEPQAVLWADADGSVWRARLGSDVLRSVREPLSRW